MAYDPKLIYKKLAELLGGTKDQGPSRGEYMDVPGVGNIRVGGSMVDKGITNWDPMEIWNKSPATAGGAPVPRYAEGEIPDWVKGAGSLFQASIGKADPEDLQGLARHWLLGEGVDPFYKGAHEAMPAWVKAYLEGIMGGYKSGAPQSGTGLPAPGADHSPA